MRIDNKSIREHNERHFSLHEVKLKHALATIQDADAIITKLTSFNVAIPSWALGTGGTRFARFSGAGEPGNLEQKMEDVALLHALNMK